MTNENHLMTGLSLALLSFMGCSRVCLNHKVEPEQANEGHFVAFVCLLRVFWKSDATVWVTADLVSWVWLFSQTFLGVAVLWWRYRPELRRQCPPRQPQYHLPLPKIRLLLMLPYSLESRPDQKQRITKWRELKNQPTWGEPTSIV